MGPGTHVVVLVFELGAAVVRNFVHLQVSLCIES